MFYKISALKNLLNDWMSKQMSYHRIKYYFKISCTSVKFDINSSQIFIEQLLCDRLSYMC